jgi:uncharacterized repeat protein (TIGR02543 family)
MRTWKHCAIVGILAFFIVSACDNGNTSKNGNGNQTPTYTVIFDADNGTANITQTVAEGGKVSEPQGVTRKRYTLDGWYNGETKWDFANNLVTGNLTLHAKWSLDANLITLDFDGQTVDRIFEIHNTTEWNAAIGIIQGSTGGNYLINVNDSFAVPPSDYQSITFGNISDVTVVIWGDSQLSLSSPGYIFYIGGAYNQTALQQTVVLRDITLLGRADNTNSLVFISYFGTLEMKGNTVISGNIITYSSASGVGVQVSGGTFIMESGIISGNTGIISFAGSGGGVALFGVGTPALGEYRNFPFVFIKTGGTIYGYTEGDPLSNVVKGNDGSIKTGAALASNGYYREKTIWPDQQLEYDGSAWVKWVDDDGVVTNQ